MLTRVDRYNRLERENNRCVQRIRVLVTDRDQLLRSMIVGHFRKDGWAAIPLSTQQLLESAATLHNASLLVLDLRLGSARNFDVLRSVRARSSIPIIVIGEHDCSEIERALGLELGADDCMVKPLSFRELSARVRTILRRRHPACSVAQQDDRLGRVWFSGWDLDLRTRNLTDPAGVLVRLTKGEYALLTAFLDAPRRTLAREQLLRAIRLHCDTSERSIDVQVLRLRRKLKSGDGATDFIATERGAGYSFSAKVERVAPRSSNS
jgi:DNA-binding response OmpR family regulator